MYRTKLLLWLIQKMKKRLITASFLLISGITNAQEAAFNSFDNSELQLTDVRLKEQPKRKYTADEVLNGQIKWSNPYPVVVHALTEGFDKSKLGKYPGTGVYPRIFTSPYEFPAIKSRLENTVIGKQLLAVAHNELTDMRAGKGDAGKLYVSLKNNELKHAFNENLFRDIENLVAIQGLLAQLYNDKALKTETGVVSGNLIKLMIQFFNSRPQNPIRSSEVKEEIYSGGKLAKLFDFTAACLSAGDKKLFIDFFVKETTGKFGDGMNLPHHWRRWNHISMSLDYPFSILAIEGQKGYDKRIYDRGVELLHDYLTYTFTDEGMSTEGMTYTFGHFGDNILLMTAIARREKINPFFNAHFRAIPDWLVYTLSPNPKALWTSHGDTGSATLLPWEMMMYMKYFFPNDRKIDYVFANAIPAELKKVPDVGAFVLVADPDKTAAQYNGVPPVALPLTYFSAERGTFIARDKWSKNGMCFQFDGRQDMLFQSHDHSDKGNFNLASHGRLWVVDGWRSTETKYHSAITIDDRGQGYFATPATWINYIDRPEATFGVIDYKYSFDWFWIKSPAADIMTGQKTEKMWEEGVYGQTAKKLESYYPGIKPQRDPLRKVAEYFSGSIESNPLIWHEDSWPMRMPNYQVEYAFRTAGMVKGVHNYVLIVDDLKKDNQERLYNWNMPMPLDVELVSIKQLVDVTQGTGHGDLGFNHLANKGIQGEYDIVLGDKSMKRNLKDVDDTVGETYFAGKFTPVKGNPQLLVRVLERTPAPRPNLEPNPRLEVIEKLKTEDMHQFYLRTMDIGKRLVIPSRSGNPNFKVLLFPYLQGEELPTTKWNEDRTKLNVEWSDQIDEFTFTKVENGRTKVKLFRNGQVIFDL
jgi:hypothetical protein